MTTTTEQAPAPYTGKKSSHLSFILIVGLLLIIGSMLCWQFDIFKSRPRIVMVAGEGPYFNLIVEGAREAARQYDVDLTVVRAKGDAQADTIRGLLDAGYDGLAVSPINPIAEAGLLADAAGRTTLVTFDSDTPVSNRLCFVGTDNYAAGRLAGEQVRRNVQGGEVLISSGALDKENVQRRRQGVVDELLDRSFEPTRETDEVEQPLKGPTYTIVATLIDTGSGEDVIAQTVKTLKDHPGIKAVVGLNTASTPRLMKALEQAGKLGQIQIVGFDAHPETLDGISNGAVYATVVQDQFGCGFHTVRILSENATGNRSGLPMFQRRTLPVEVVTRENVESARAQLAKDAPATQPGM